MFESYGEYFTIVPRPHDAGPTKTIYGSNKRDAAERYLRMFEANLTRELESLTAHPYECRSFKVDVERVTTVSFHLADGQ